MSVCVAASSTASLIAIPRLPGESGVLGEDAAAGIGAVARAGEHFRAPGVHHHAAIRLLLVAHPHHVDRAFQAEQRQASDSALPHCPAPVSVARRRMPACLL